MNNPQTALDRLRPIYIFRSLSDEELLRVAALLEVEHHPAGTRIFSQDDPGTHFYIIHRGQVNVVRRNGRADPRVVATFVEGDFFGEGGLLSGRKRSASIDAVTDVDVFKLSQEGFNALAADFPHIKPNLRMSYNSYVLLHRHMLNWLGKGEVVYLITRRHQFILLQHLLAPVVVGAVIALLALWLAVWMDALWIAWAGALTLVPVAAWLLWAYVDWANDYYIVTSQRLVALNKVVLIYDSRQEAPLSSIMSIEIQSDDLLQRWLRMGDVMVRTFSGPITLVSVPNPHEMAAAVDQYWKRTQAQKQQTEIEMKRNIIRQRLKDGVPITAPTLLNKPKPPSPIAVEKTKKSALTRLIEFFTLRLRYQEGDVVVYRKHWFILAKHIWKPTLAILGALVFTVTALAGGLPLSFGLPVILLTGLVVMLPAAAWWLYEYMDWKNDIYMVTSDQIIDIAKKPLGTENRKAAPLGNVLSLKSEKPGLLGVLLNYGNVVAQVANAEFRFQGVFDPVSVQNDVYRRLEEFGNKKTAADAARQRAELGDWLAVYHEELVKFESGQPPAQTGDAAP